MNTHISDVLQAYYARERETLATEPAVRAELRQLGIVRVTAEYDGVADSGQIERISFHGDVAADTAVEVNDETSDRVEALLYALLNLRHGGWENNDGAFGSFRWNLGKGTLEHQHHQRYTDCAISVHEGFGTCAGAQP